MNNQVNIEITEDGSVTLFSDRVKETYHSIHGAVQESNHVFIKAGLQTMIDRKDVINILEVGFGTGLNALLTLKEILHFHHDNATEQSIEKKEKAFTESSDIKQPVIYYTALEPFPIELSLISKLQYPEYLSAPDLEEAFINMHQSDDGSYHKIKECFQIRKLQTPLQSYETKGLLYDLIYFDAFSPAVEPELWTIEVFQQLFEIMSHDSALVTYCSKGIVRRMMEQCGFKVERLPGPPGKHEMLRALKRN